MARYTALLAISGFALLALASAQSPALGRTDPQARCIIYFDAAQGGGVKDNTTKTCFDCQKLCLSLSDGQCGSYSWNGTLLKNPEEAPVFQCAAVIDPNDPALGTCAHFQSNNIYPTSFAPKYCQDCIEACRFDSLCTKIAWAGNVLNKGAEQTNFVCPPKPSPRPSSPAIVPSPIISSPSVVPSPTPCTTPYAYISGNANLTTLKAAIDAARLDTLLQDPTLVGTLFAPTNAAFAAALTTLNLTPAQLLGDINTLTAVLTFHLVPGAAVLSTQLNNGQQLTTALGESSPKIVVSTPPPTFTPTFTGTAAGVVTADVRACATIIHVINQVLDPLP